MAERAIRAKRAFVGIVFGVARIAVLGRTFEHVVHMTALAWDDLVLAN